MSRLIRHFVPNLNHKCIFKKVFFPDICCSFKPYHTPIFRKLIGVSRNFTWIILIGPTLLFCQTPSFSLGSNSKYFDFKETFVSNDFKNVSQILIGPYLTLGNFGFTNSSWIGNNALLDYSSYGSVGSLGSKNMFVPLYDSGTALIMELNMVTGNLEGYNHEWNQLATSVDFTDFERIWQIGKNNSFFLSNVGIGTNSPDSKLTVKGKIHAEEVKIDLSVPGADYVFEEGYKLMSLQDIQQFIKEHGHLPNVPSAKDMEENGVELGVMNMKLLEKIEELTLYIILQKKDIDKVQEQYKLLLSQLNELNEKLK